MFAKNARPIAWPLFFFYFFFCAMIGVMMPYISVYYKSIGLTASEIGRLMSTFTLSGIIIPHFWGWLTTKIGLPRRILQLAVIGCFIALLPFNWTNQFETFWLLTCVMALFYSALLPMTDALVVRSIRYLNVPYTRIRVGGSIGYVVAVVGAGFLIEHFGAWIVIPSMCAFLSLTVITTLFVKEQEYEKHKTKHTTSFISLLKEPESLLFFGLAFLAFMSHAPFNVFFAVHLSNANYSGDQIGLLMALGVIVEILLFLFFGNLIKHYHVVHLVALCFVVGIIRWFLVGWFVSSIWVLAFTQLLHCITFALFHMVSIEQVRRLFPERYAGQGQAMYSAFAIGLGGGLGMVLTGYLWEWAGGEWAFTASSCTSALALIILLVNQKR
ncbi:MFS transporter [Marinomonas sp. 5E14-1]|uniref:MFS transporter n=1 Tax=Marinomonas sp. 5E14-1 TaxID=3153922 RepID=UPI0032657027